MSRFQLSSYLTIVSLCVIAAAGWIYDRDIRQAEARPPAVEAGRDDSRTDCNGNGVEDEDEMHPLPGQALAFDGDGDYVDPGASSALADLTQGDFTIEAWIRTDDPGHAVLVGNAGGASHLYNFVIRGEDEGGIIRLRTADGTTSHTCDGSSRVNDGAWHHVAASRWINGPGCIRLYVDGEECAVLWGDFDMTSFTADNATLIGRDQQPSPHYFNGAMDEVRVWNVGRFRDDIHADMYRVLDGDEPGLVAYWRFDEGTGSVAYDSAGDSDGALVGSTAWAPFGADCNLNRVLDECDTIVDGVIYVDDDATSGLNDGLSWANAFEDLQDALACAACDSRVTEIRVAEGTYKPGWHESDSFHLVNGVALRGGYRGLAGGGDPDDRDIDAFESILSGDVHVIGDPDDNCWHVVVCETADESTVIEGFTITEGNASGPVEGDEYGGGMYIAEGANPTIARCKFVANRAESGGGIYNDFGRPTLTECTFSGNSAAWGGALYGGGLLANTVTIANCMFSGNSADGMGGAIFYASGTIRLTNCTFSGNSAGTHGGAAAVDHRSLSMTFVNCTFSGNSAGTLGGVLFSVLNSYSSIHAVNCVLWGNTAASYPQMDTGADVAFSCVEGGYAGAGNIDADPLFVDADGPDGIHGTADDDLHLLEGSPCINTGDDESIPEGVTIDLDGAPRVQQCHVDMGAYETPYFVGDDCNNNGASDECDIENCDGSPWCEDCNENDILDECDIAGGTAQDCNENGIPDECDVETCDGSLWCEDCNENGVPDGCDIAGGTSQDCNENGIPDECDIETCDGSLWCQDCNENGVPDECDLSSGAGQDCNGNGVLDECETIVDGAIFVDDDATGGLNDGLSWADAFVDLQDALAYAECDSRVTEIRVAGGTYKPGTDREDSFHLVNGIALRGGYRGLAGGGDPDDRDIDGFESILSGDIGVIGESGDNCRHVVVCENADETTVFEGFTSTAGKGSGVPGGGMLIGEAGSPTIVQCRFVANGASQGGGIRIISNAAPTILNCTFSGNSASKGGGLSSVSLTGTTIANCTFSNNSAGDGGGMYIEDGAPTLSNCTFSNNSANNYGGGLGIYIGSTKLSNCTFSSNNSGVYGGGMFACHGTPTLTNCTFSGNLAMCGGGMSAQYASPTLTNCTFTGNRADEDGGGINQQIGHTTVVNCAIVGNSAGNCGGGGYNSWYLEGVTTCKNCIIWANTAPQSSQTFLLDIDSSCVQGGHSGSGNIHDNPLFVDSNGPDGIYGTADDDLHLQEGSPCINAGDNGAIPEGVTIDFDGEPRVQQCRVDMGVDETPYFEDCNSNGASDECDIQDCDGSAWCGDCNGNGVPDGCDIASGASTDLDGNGVPDECEMFGDCDHDGDIDLDDLEAMLGCLFGPDETPSEGCECGDGDADLDVDLADFALFQQAFTGSQP